MHLGTGTSSTSVEAPAPPEQPGRVTLADAARIFLAPRISDILVTTPQFVYVERNGKPYRTSVEFKDNTHLNCYDLALIAKNNPARANHDVVFRQHERVLYFQRVARDRRLSSLSQLIAAHLQHLNRFEAAL